MRVAIIGGGASGMVTAYFLNQNGHEVTVFERQPILGGHIRTLNKNVATTQIPTDYYLEAGVLEFPAVFHNFLALMRELEVEIETVNMGSALFLKDGNYFLSDTDIQKNFQGFKRAFEYLKLDALYVQSVGLWIKMMLSKLEDLQDQPISRYFKAGYLGDCWMELLTMYSYSMPIETLDHFPAALAIPTLRDDIFTHWYRIKGGVYSYIEKILERFTGQVLFNVDIVKITRLNQAVQIHLAHGTTVHFDKVVFATPPDQVLKLLADPYPEEVIRFLNWQKNEAQTIIHTDTAMYQKYGIQEFSEFDFLQSDQGWGYNAHLNQLCGISSEVQYSLAFNLQSLIPKDKIIHVQPHHTPFYTVEAFHSRDEIIASNGDHHTYHVGAYLGDGLHEGAVVSAQRVAALMG